MKKSDEIDEKLARILTRVQAQRNHARRWVASWPNSDDIKAVARAFDAKLVEVRSKEINWRAQYFDDLIGVTPGEYLKPRLRR